MYAYNLHVTKVKERNMILSEKCGVIPKKKRINLERSLVTQTLGHIRCKKKSHRNGENLILKANTIAMKIMLF